MHCASAGQCSPRLAARLKQRWIEDPHAKPWWELPPQTDDTTPAKDETRVPQSPSAPPKEASSATPAALQEASRQQPAVPGASESQQKAAAASESFQGYSLSGWRCDPPEGIVDVQMYDLGGVYPEVDESKVILLEPR